MLHLSSTYSRSSYTIFPSILCYCSHPEISSYSRILEAPGSKLCPPPATLTEKFRVYLFISFGGYKCKGTEPPFGVLVLSVIAKSIECFSVIRNSYTYCVSVPSVIAKSTVSFSAICNNYTYCVFHCHQ